MPLDPNLECVANLPVRFPIQRLEGFIIYWSSERAFMGMVCIFGVVFSGKDVEYLVERELEPTFF